MSTKSEPLTDFERHAGTALNEGAQRVDGRIRSRLNQARQAAVASAARRRERTLWHVNLMPAAGALAGAVLVALILFQGRLGQLSGDALLPVTPESTHPALDLDLLADREGLELIEEWDGSFYEWAAEQGDSNPETDG